MQRGGPEAVVVPAALNLNGNVEAVLLINCASHKFKALAGKCASLGRSKL